MQLELLSFNGTAFSPNFSGYILYPKPLKLSGEAQWLDVAGTFAQYTGKSFGGGYLTIQVVYEGAFSDVHLREAEISRWFDTFDEAPRKLLAKDTADDDREWYVMATPLSVAQEENSAVIVLALEEPFWRVETNSTSEWNINTDTSTQNVTCLGESAEPIFEITPTNAKAVGYTYFRFVEVVPQSAAKALPNYPINFGPLDTAALVTDGKAQASGNDFRLFVNGVEWPLFFGTGAAAFNQAATKIWTALNLAARVTLTLGAAIHASNPISEITFQNTTANKKAIKKLPASGCVKIVTGGNTEYFTYSGKDATNLKLTGVTRRAKLSTNYAHSIGDSVTWVQHDIWLVYGNPAAAAPEYDNDKEPMFDLTNSSNTSWVYTEFMEEGKSRPGAWKPAQLSSTLKTSKTYTGPAGATANPATEAGLRMATKAVNGVQKSESAAQSWTLNCPAGITHIASMTIRRYRHNASFPSAAILKSANGTTYSSAQALTSPSAAKTWQTTTITSLNLGGSFPFLQLKQEGTLSAAAENEAMVEAQGGTLTIDSSGTPAVTITAENSTYYLEAKITNTTTGEAIYITFPMKLNDTLTVNCLTRRATYSDGSRAQTAIRLDSDRVDWLNFVHGVNQLSFEDEGTTGVTISIAWSDKAAV